VVIILLVGSLSACGGDDAGAETSGNTQTQSGDGGAESTASSTTSSHGGGGSTANGGAGGGGGVGGATSSAGGSGGGTTASGGAGGGGGTTTTTGSTTTTGGAGDLDQDGDGWTPNQGDCCDTTNGCQKPELVNPGAFEYLNNSVDDDCDATTLDNVLPNDCGGNPLETPTASDALIRAMDLCRTTTEAPALPEKTWGVISTELVLADGTLAPNDLQVGVLGAYGDNVKPKLGATMAAISSGTARAMNDPGFVHPKNGKQPGQNGNFNANTTSGAPADFLAEHGGNMPSGCGPICSGNACTTAYDSVNLKARIRVPTNAKGFSYMLKFYSAEYPQYLCKEFNDFFLTLVDSQLVGQPNQIPLDKNIAFDSAKSLVSVNNALLNVCVSQGNVTCTDQTELIGTGMGGWGNALDDGGGTEWLTNDAVAKPGETMEIRFVIWDAGDHNVDSLVLLDKFTWKLEAAGVGVHN
jgi:hypothetical protein